MAKVGSLLIDLAMNTARLQADAGKAAQSINRMEKNFGGSLRRIERNFSSVTRGLSRFAGALGIAVGAGGLGFMVKSSVDAADKIQKLSIRLGASTEALSEYQHVAALSGITFETFTMGLQRMTRRVAEAAQGTGEARGALEELGLTATQLTRLRPEDQFELIADAMQGVTNQADRVRLAMKLFDSEGVSLIQTMGKGAAGIREMRGEAKRLGLTLTQDGADAAANANDQITRLSASIRGTLVKAINAAGPALENFAALLSGERTIRKVEAGLDSVQARINETRQVIQELRTDPGVFASMREALGTETIQQAIDRNLELLRGYIQNRSELLSEQQGMLPVFPAANMEQMPEIVTIDLIEQARMESMQRIAQATFSFEDSITAYSAQKASERAATVKFETDIVSGLRQQAANRAVGLLQTLGQKNKAFALAGIALQKLLAISQINMEAGKALMAAKFLAYSTGNPAAFAGFAADINSARALNIGLVAATGFAEAANVNSGTGTSTGGVPPSSNTVGTVGGAVGTNNTSGQQTTIILQGDVYGFDDFREKVTEAVRAATDSDTIIIGRNTRQALEFA